MSRRTAALVLVLLAALVPLAACGSDEQSRAGTPGFDANGDPVDDEPFRLAQPTTTEGPTTIPGGPQLPLPTTPDGEPIGDEVAPEQGGTEGNEPAGREPRPATDGGAQDPIVAITTTTTTPPTAPVAPDAGSIQNLCGMTASLASFNTIMTNRAVDVPTAVGALVRNMDRYLAVSPPLLRAQVGYVRDVIADIVSIISRNGYDVQSAPVRQAVIAAASGQAPYANLVTVTNEIGAYERTVC